MADRWHLIEGVLERLRARLLAGLIYYPMLVLLLIVLATIHLSHWLGTGTTLCLYGLAWILYLWSRLYAPKPGALAMPRNLLFMGLIALAYGALHDFQITQVRDQLRRWNQAHVTDSQDPTKAYSWKPVVLQGSIEQTLRYRRASIPNQNTTDENLIDDWQTMTIIHVSKVKYEDSWSKLSLDASMAIDGKLSGVFPGDQVTVYGHWRRPLPPRNPGQFDLRNRYAELGLAASIKVESPALVEPNKPGSLWRLDRWLAIWTDRALLAMDRYVILQQSPLTAALVLGQREQADWQFQEQMLATGTIHMLSISGMHIEMVALSLLICGWMLRIPKGLVMLGTVGVCILYALLCGANPPVARATIMLTGACTARYLGWSFSSLNILAFAGLVILSQRTSVAFEVGTQLSFLTVSVLILTFPLLRHRTIPIQRLIESKESGWSKFLRGLRWLCWESIRSSFWVSLISAPLVWCSFHIISPISIVLNLLLWLPMLVALLSGLGLVLLFWLPPAAWFFGACCGLSLWFLSLVVAVAHKIPFGHFWSAAPPTWWLIGFYSIAMGITLWLGTKRQGARRVLLWGLGSWLVLGFVWLESNQAVERFLFNSGRSTLKVTFLDVGHGTSVLIQTPDGRHWLYDAGRLGDHQRSYQPIAQALWSMGVGQIDGLILSHADSDHYNAMEGLIERFSVRRFITTKEVGEHPSPSLRQLFDKVQSQRIPIDYWNANTSATKNELYGIIPIYPRSDTSSPPFRLASSKPKKYGAKSMSDNAKSLCLVIECSNRRILLPGDLENPGTEILTAGLPIDVDVLMAPHHGSLTSRQDKLIAWCSPSTIVISGSYKSLDPRVFETYSPSGQDVLHTAKDHALQLRIEPNGSMQWYQWSENHWLTISK
jgi:competence protein ComEC